MTKKLSIKNAAAELGKRGALSRNRNLTPERRTAIAKLAAKARWDKFYSEGKKK